MPGIDEIREFLDRNGIEVHEFNRETPTAETAALAVGCTPAEIAKSILLLVGGVPVMVVTSGDMKVNSSMLKQASGLTGKVKLPNEDDVRRYTGYEPGGVCPFLLPDDLPVFIDTSLQRFATIYPAAGTRNSAVPLDFPSLCRITGGVTASVSLPLV